MCTTIGVCVCSVRVCVIAELSVCVCCVRDCLVRVCKETTFSGLNNYLIMIEFNSESYKSKPNYT